MDPGSVPDGEERWELVQRIVSSPRFKKSPRLQQFLLFIAECTLTGRSGEITEYAIAWEVFERPKDYDPSGDSIVRTAAHQLRSKIKEYFDVEGSSETLTLDIPKGAYMVTFTRRDDQHATVNGPSPADSPHPVPPPAPLVRRWRIISGTFAILAVGALGIAIALWRHPADPGPLPAETIASTVLTGANPTRLVVGDYGAVLLSIATRRALTVEEYANRSYENSTPDAQNPVLANLSRPTVSLPDLKITEMLLRLSWKEKKDLVVHHAREVNARDLRSGNSILLASPVANPWIGLFEHKLNFRFHVRYEPNATAGSSEYLNVHPNPGEQANYPGSPTAAPKFGLAYGLVARLPNLDGTGKILLICGQKFTGFQAAGEYATDPRAAAELARLLNAKNVREMPDFEVLLETNSIDFTPRYVKPVAFRRISN